MLSKHLKSAVALTALLLSTQAGATDSSETAAQERTAALAANRALAKQAVTKATEDAIRSVLLSTRHNLDNRLGSRKSVETSRQAVDGR